jgi:hypothetical protein
VKAALTKREKRKKKPSGRRRQEAPLVLSTRKLADAVDALAHTQYHTVRLEDDGRRRLKRVRLACLYDQLVDAVSAHRGGRGGSWAGQFPFWADAHVLLCEIDAAVLAMHPAPHRWTGWTVERLAALTAHPWRPQDCAEIDAYTRLIESFVKRGEGLFNPKPIPLADACPDCGEKTVYRDKDGEEVRTPALQITEDGATCGACRANWPLERLPMLGRILGYGEQV